MKILKKILFIYFAIFILFPVLVFATTISLPNPLTGVNNITDLVEKIIDFIKIVAYGVAPVAIVIAGFYFLTSNGEPGKIATARSIIFWTLLGVLIVASADILVSIIQDDIGLG